MYKIVGGWILSIKIVKTHLDLLVYDLSVHACLDLYLFCLFLVSIYCLTLHCPLSRCRKMLCRAHWKNVAVNINKKHPTVLWVEARTQRFFFYVCLYLHKIIFNYFRIFCQRKTINKSLLLLFVIRTIQYLFKGGSLIDLLLFFFCSSFLKIVFFRLTKTSRWWVICWLLFCCCKANESL